MLAAVVSAVSVNNLSITSRQFVNDLTWMLRSRMSYPLSQPAVALSAGDHELHSEIPCSVGRPNSSRSLPCLPSTQVCRNSCTNRPSRYTSRSEPGGAVNTQCGNWITLPAKSSGLHALQSLLTCSFVTRHFPLKPATFPPAVSSTHLNVRLESSVAIRQSLRSATIAVPFRWPTVLSPFEYLSGTRDHTANNALLGVRTPFKHNFSGGVSSIGRAAPHVLYCIHSTLISNRIPARKPPQLGRVKAGPVIVVADPVVQRCMHRSSHLPRTGVATRIRHRSATSRQHGIRMSADDRSLAAERWTENPSFVTGLGQLHFSRFRPAAQHRPPHASAELGLVYSEKGLFVIRLGIRMKSRDDGEDDLLPRC